MIPRVDVGGALLELVVGRVDPGLRASIEWRLARRRGDVVPRILAELVRPGGVAVDVGASWGLFTYRLARLAGSQGRVHAFEPNPANGRSLAAIAGRAGTVTCHRCALSEEAGRAELRIPRRRGRPVVGLGTLSVAPGRARLFTDAVQVEVKRLDDALGDEADTVDFLKCDVEGHELEVLRGAERTLASRPALIVEIEQRHQGRDIRATFDHLLERGYDGYAVHAGGLTPLDEFDVERDQTSLVDETDLQPIVGGTYVHDFVFVASGSDVSSLMDPAAAASDLSKRSPSVLQS